MYLLPATWARKCIKQTNDGMTLFNFLTSTTIIYLSQVQCQNEQKTNPKFKSINRRTVSSSNLKEHWTYEIVLWKRFRSSRGRQMSKRFRTMIPRHSVPRSTSASFGLGIRRSGTWWAPAWATFLGGAPAWAAFLGACCITIGRRSIWRLRSCWWSAKSSRNNTIQYPDSRMQL